LTIETRPVRLKGEDIEGMMLLHQGGLVAIIAKLGASHAENEGHWFVEAVFGLSCRDQTFLDLPAACDHFAKLTATNI
jgi:hypothetical protein